jgi:Uma2 family endonuclease
MAASAQPFLTPEQYLEIERNAETRSEYYNGRMYAMSGGSFRHARINGNLTAGLHSRLRGRKCAVLPTDMRTVAGAIYAYPGVVIVCGEPQFAHDRKDTLLNPTAVVEVLSPSTEAYDRGFKSEQFRQVKSLDQYVIVSQIRPHVEVYRRQPDGTWALSEQAGLDAVCQFLGCSIPLQEIYDGVEFDAEELAWALIPPPEGRD